MWLWVASFLWGIRTSIRFSGPAPSCPIRVGSSIAPLQGLPWKLPGSPRQPAKLDGQPPPLSSAIQAANPVSLSSLFAGNSQAPPLARHCPRGPRRRQNSGLTKARWLPQPRLRTLWVLLTQGGGSVPRQVPFGYVRVSRGEGGSSLSLAPPDPPRQSPHTSLSVSSLSRRVWRRQLRSHRDWRRSLG